MHVTDEELFVLLIVCFSIGTMLIYWLLFQPTRKLATAIIHAIAKKANVEPVVDVIEGVLDQEESEISNATENNLQSTAENATNSEANEKTPNENLSTVVETAADKLKAMVEAIKKK